MSGTVGGAPPSAGSLAGVRDVGASSYGSSKNNYVQATMDPAIVRDRLRALLIERSVRRGDVLLASGRRSTGLELLCRSSVQ